jgi:hypothetical protein
MAMNVLAGCDWSSDSDYLKWKLVGTKKKTYSIQIQGTAILKKDLFGLDESRLSKGSPVTLSVKNESFIVVNKKDKETFELQLVSGNTSFSSFPDLNDSFYGQDALKSMFETRSGIELSKFEMGPKGSKEAPDFNRFLSLNMYLRLPEDTLLQEKKSGLSRLNIFGEDELCLNLYNRKIKEREENISITLESITKTKDGDMIAEMNYRIVEKVLTEYQEGDFAKRRFIKRFNDANIYTDRKLKLNDDDEQKTFICEYKGKHFFNMTKGWLEAAEIEQSIQLIRTDVTVKASEIFRVKTAIRPINREIVVLDEIDDALIRDEIGEHEKRKKNKPTVTDMLDLLDGGTASEKPIEQKNKSDSKELQ